MSTQAKDTITPISFEKIQEDYAAKGIDITDVNGLHGSAGKPGHFEKWHKTKGLPERDAEGIHFGSSRIFFEQYQTDADGEAAAPVFVNLWRYLLHISMVIPWEETESERTKTAPVLEAILTVAEDIDDDALPELREKIGADGAEHDGVFERLVSELRARHRQDVEARRLMMEVIDTYGTEMPEYGKVVLIDMKVER